MTLKTYEGLCAGQKVTIKLDLTLSSELAGEGSKTPIHKAHIGAFGVDDIELVPLSQATFGMLEKIMTLPNNPGMRAKEAIWVPRGENEDVARCFMAVKGGEPLGYFNIGSSQITINHADQEFTPNECGGFNGVLSPEDYAKVIYASSCYYDIVKTLNTATFGSHVIYTTKDAAMKDALLAGEWMELAKGDSFFDALTSIAPEVDDGRAPRFTEVAGQFMERCRVPDDSEQTWHYGHEDKFLLVHPMGALFDSLTEVA